LPISDALGFTGCPQVVVGKEGFYGQWRGQEGQSVIAPVSRTTPPRGAPELVEFETEPGELLGVLGSELLLSKQNADRTFSFVRLTPTGEPGGPGYLWP